MLQWVLLYNSMLNMIPLVLCMMEKKSQAEMTFWARASHKGNCRICEKLCTRTRTVIRCCKIVHRITTVRARSEGSGYFSSMRRLLLNVSTYVSNLRLLFFCIRLINIYGKFVKSKEHNTKLKKCTCIKYVLHYL